jgi:hypothetical protein
VNVIADGLKDSFPHIAVDTLACEYSVSACASPVYIYTRRSSCVGWLRLLLPPTCMLLQINGPAPPPRSPSRGLTSSSGSARSSATLRFH